MAAVLLTAIAFASSSAGVMLPILSAMAADTGVRVCVVSVMVVVE